MNMDPRPSKPLIDPSEPASLAWLQRVARRFAHGCVIPDDVVTDVLIRTKCKPQPSGLYCQMIKHMAINHWRTQRLRAHLPIECAMHMLDPTSEAEEKAVCDRLFIDTVKPYLMPEELRIFQSMADGDTICDIAQSKGTRASGMRTKIGRVRGRMNREMGNDIDAPWGVHGRR